MKEVQKMARALYQCSNCRQAVSKSDRVCPHCRVSLVGIRCQNCGFVGGEQDFPNDLCKKCGSRVVKAADPAEESPELGCIATLIMVGICALLYYFGNL